MEEGTYKDIRHNAKKEVFLELIAKCYDYNEHKLPQEEIIKSMKRHFSALQKKDGG